MTDNEKLARWQGWAWEYTKSFPHLCTIYKPDGDEFCIKTESLPDYPTDSAACMSLLDTLVEKGWEYSLFGYPDRMNKADFRIYKDYVGISMAIKPTINQAIITACLEVAKEGKK